MAKILLIDDDVDFVDILEMRLDMLGHEVVSAYEGNEGLGKVVLDKPDLVIVDATLPGLSGYEICSKIREDENVQDIAIMMLSGRSAEADIQKGKDAGANDYLVKPFEPATLIEKLNNLLGK